MWNFYIFYYSNFFPILVQRGIFVELHSFSNPPLLTPVKKCRNREKLKICKKLNTSTKTVADTQLFPNGHSNKHILSVVWNTENVDYSVFSIVVACFFR